MNDDKHKSIWKKSWKGSNLLGAWLFIRWLCCLKNFRRFLFGLACLATLVALAYAEEDWRGWHAWNRFKHEWEAKGEKFDYAGVIPPPVPDSQNFAMAPIWVESMKAVLGPTNSLQWFGSYVENGRTNFVDWLYMPTTDGTDSGPTNGAGNWQLGTVTDLKPWQEYYRSLAAKTNLFPVAPQPQTPAQDVLLALSKYDSTIGELREASRRPYSRFPLYSNPDRPFDTLLPHLATLKRCTQVLQLRAIAELQNGQSDQALDDVKLLLRLIESIRTEPFLISHLVRIAMLQYALQPIYEGLAHHQWSDAQLAELDSALAKLDFLADYKLTMRGERACEIAAAEIIRHGNPRSIKELLGLNDNSAQGNMTALLFNLCPGGWIYQNELRIGRFYQNWYLPLVNETERTVSPSAVHAVYAALDAELHHRTPENFLEPWLLPALGAAVQKFAYAQESADLARVAIALERHRLAHGEYPESLGALAPQFMAKIPHDIIGGGPLHDRRTSDGQFVFYSVGWNETDDGGAVVLYRSASDRVDITKGDWVWRYPSTN